MQAISFFIPAFNCSATITEAVDSVMETNFSPNDELIIVNDCSTDETAQVLERLKAKYPKTIVLAHSINKGGAAARNTAVENASNDLLFCLDSDNVLSPSSVVPLKKYLLANNADVASFQYQHFFSSEKLTPEYIWSLPEGELSLTRYLRRDNTPGQHGNYLFTKQSWLIAKGYAEGTGALDTWTFGLRQAITGARTIVLKDTFYYHRLDHKNSYWMRDAEANLWSVSVKAAYSLYPFFDIIDEKFLKYMLGKGRYTWFHDLKSKPLVLVERGSKDGFYARLNKKITNHIYPAAPVTKMAINKFRRKLGL